MTRIVTQLDKNAVVAALRELAPEAYNPHFYRSTFEGEVGTSRVTIGYRWGWFVPPIRLVTFSGQLGEVGDGTLITGSASYGWIVYLFAIWWLTVAPLSIVARALTGEFATTFWALVVAVAVFFFGRAFARATRDYVVREIARAVRGRISSD